MLGSRPCTSIRCRQLATTRNCAFRNSFATKPLSNATSRRVRPSRRRSARRRRPANFMAAAAVLGIDGNSTKVLLTAGRALFRIWNKNGFAARRNGNRHKLRAVDKLTEREQQVALLVAQGWTNAQIAVRLNISMQTAKNHLRATFAKTGARNRVQLTRLVLVGARPRPRGARPRPYGG